MVNEYHVSLEDVSINKRINSTNSPASNLGNVREPRLMSQVGKSARQSVCFCSHRGGRCQCWSTDVVFEIRWRG